MKKTLLFFTVILIASTTSAQTQRKVSVNLTADGAASMVGYLPEQPSGRAIVDCPGGGYSHLSMENEGHDWAGYFNRLGIAYFVLTYRMPKGDYTIPTSDAENAIAIVRDSASLWNINPNDVGMMGFSAGGHLASTTATHSEYDQRPDFLILFYPVISMERGKTHAGSVQQLLGDHPDERLVRLFCNERQVRRHLTPPTIILLANDDRAVPPVTNGIAFYSAMRQAGNDCTLHVYPSGGHGFGFRSSFAYHQQMLDDLTTWLQHRAAPRPDAVRVACIGNSITDGSGIDMAERFGYPAQLQTLLGKDYWVRNFGVGARTMLNKGDHPYMQELAWRDALAFRPDVVVIKLGTNDSKDDNWKHGGEYQHDLQQMVDSLRALPSKPRIILATPIPAFKPSWTINDSVIVNGVIPVIRKVAKTNKLEVIDLHTLMADDQALILSDGIHPNDKGARRMAEHIARQIADKPKK